MSKWKLDQAFSSSIIIGSHKKYNCVINFAFKNQITNQISGETNKQELRHSLKQSNFKYIFKDIHANIIYMRDNNLISGSSFDEVEHNYIHIW